MSMWSCHTKPGNRPADACGACGSLTLGRPRGRFPDTARLRLDDGACRRGSLGPVCEARTWTRCLRVVVGILVSHGREDVKSRLKRGVTRGIRASGWPARVQIRTVWSLLPERMPSSPPSCHTATPSPSRCGTYAGYRRASWVRRARNAKLTAPADAVFSATGDSSSSTTSNAAGPRLGTQRRNPTTCATLSPRRRRPPNCGDLRPEAFADLLARCNSSV